MTQVSNRAVHLLVSIFILVAPALCLGEPPSVFLEELTWVEVEQAVAEGHTTIILPTGGTEQNGPHMVLGKHNAIVKRAAEMVAQRLGNALVAPVVAYVPEGEVRRPAGHMRFPGTITLPDDYFEKLIEYAARSFKLHGFTDIALIGDSGGNLKPLERVASRLNREWRDTAARVHYIDRFTRGRAYRDWLRAQGETDEQIGRHAGIMDTSVAMAVDPRLVRTDKMAPSTDFYLTGVVGDPTRASVEYGLVGLELQVEGAVSQIRELTSAR